MEKMTQTNMTKPGIDLRLKIIFAFLISLFLYSAFFYNLLKEQVDLLIQRQSALESIKALAVPGTAFLNSMSGLDIFKSSLFYLVLLGMMFLVFLSFSLLFKSPWKRGGFLFAGLIGLILLTIHDRVSISFGFVIFISFSSFYLLTLQSNINISLKEIIVLLLLMIVVSGSLFYGSKNKFFVKSRDRLLFDTLLGNKIISFYYTYSPLAASLISMEKGIYEGVIFHEGIKNKKYIYLGKGLFLSGKKELKETSDFIISKDGTKFNIISRHGKMMPVGTINITEIENKIDELFSMKGFLFLNKIGLYFFPAGVIILFLMGIKWLTDNKKIFIFSNAGFASILVIFILSISFSGKSPPNNNFTESGDLSSQGLATAHYLYQKKEIPEAYMNVVKNMAGSGSPALRYWGAYLLGTTGNINESKILIPLLEDPFLNVRYTAALSLYKLLKQESFRYLIARLFNDPIWYVRCRIFSVFIDAGMIPSPA